MPFYLQLSDLSRHVLFRLPRRVIFIIFIIILIIIIAVVVSAISLQREKARERGRERPSCQQRRLAGNIFASSVLVSRDQSRTTFYQD